MFFNKRNINLILLYNKEKERCQIMDKILTKNNFKIIK